MWTWINRGGLAEITWATPHSWQISLFWLTRTFFDFARLDPFPSIVVSKVFFEWLLVVPRSYMMSSGKSVNSNSASDDNLDSQAIQLVVSYGLHAIGNQLFSSSDQVLLVIQRLSCFRKESETR